MELGGGHPRATMRIAQQAHLVSLELDTREIDLDLVQVGFERALEGDRPTMEQVVERIRLLHKQGLLVARTVAAGQPLPADPARACATACSSCSATPASSSTSRAAAGG